MSLIGFTLEIAGDVSSFTSSVRTQVQGAIAARAGVGPSAVELTVTAGSVIVAVRIHTPTAMATSVQSAIASATSSPSSATTMLASVSGVSIAVLAVVTPPTLTNVAPPPPSPPPSSPSPSPLPQRPPDALNSAGGGAISILAIAVPAVIVALLCCLAMVCWWTRRRGVELRRKDVNNWLRNMSASTVSAEELHQQVPPACSVSNPSGRGGSGGGVGIEMSDRYSSETEGSARADRAEGGARKQDMARQLKEEAHSVAGARTAREGATIVHQPPWGRSSASSAADLSVVTDFHDYHVDAGKHQLSDYELRKEGDDTGGDGGGNGGGRACGSSSGASGSMEAPNCNDPDAPRSAVPGMLHI